MDDVSMHERFNALAGRWWHSIDLGQYGRTEGYKSAETLDREWNAMQVPNLSGRSVLDVGAWDGYFSFRAEQEGAASVTALDHFVWSIDPVQKVEYEARCSAEGVPPQPFDEVDFLWRPEELPGKATFDFAHQALRSSVRTHVANFMEDDELPSADVVFFLGVLYHLKEPVVAMERLFSVTEEVAIIETEAIHVPGQPDLPLAEFIPGRVVGADGVHSDPTNWWIPTGEALASMAISAGFSRVEHIVGPPAQGSPVLRQALDHLRPLLRGSAPAPIRYRAVMRAWA